MAKSCLMTTDALLLATIDALTKTVAQQGGALKSAQLTIDKLKLELAYLRRMRYGRSSEQMDAQQLELLAQNAQANPAPVIDLEVERARRKGQSRKRPDLRHLPEHLPRETVVHEHSHGADCTCAGCGSELRAIGQDVSEVLDYEPGSFKVVRHVRPKYACGQCNSICQAEAPERPIERGMAGAGLLAHVLTSKYCDHLPLYRQSQIYRRVGVDLHRSTLADWVGQTSALLRPLVDSLARHVMQGAKVHADDTPVSVLDPGRGRTRIARLWAYVRDDRPAADLTPPAVWFQYSPDRKGEHPARHLRAFHGILQADGYAGFNALYEPTREAGVILEAACWAHVRRKFYEIHEDQKRLPGTLAAQALLRIAQLYAVETPIRGRPPDERRDVRQTQSRVLVDELHHWLQDALAQVSAKSAVAKAIGYASTRWTALTRYLDDGRIEMDNNAAERAIRGIALGRKNWLFAGSNAGGDRAAAVYSLIETAKLNGVNPQSYLTEVIGRIGRHPINRVDELLPWNLAPQLQSAAAPQSAAA